VSELNPDEPFPASVIRVSRAKGSGTQTVSLPEGYLENLDDDSPPVEGEEAGDGG